MALQPARTMKLPSSTELSTVIGDHLVATNAHPDRTHVYDLTRWPLAAREVSGFFASHLDARPDGTLLAAARHHHPNPYRLYALDPRTLAVKALPNEGSSNEIAAAFALDDDAIVAPPGPGDRTPYRWHDGARTPLDLAPPAPPDEVTHDGHRLRMPARHASTDVFPLPHGEAVVVWNERLHRLAGVTITPLATDHVLSFGSPLREGRSVGVDDRGRALTALAWRFVSIDRDGVIELVSPGSDHVTGNVAGPNGTWLLACDEEIHVVFPREQAVIELDLSAMRIAPRFPMFMPKAHWVAARNALLVVHGHDAWEWDFDAVCALKKVPFAKHAAKLASSKRAAWSRKVKAAQGAPIALDALPMSTRGSGTLVEHAEYGPGVVQGCAETRQGGAITVTATVMFEGSTRAFVYQGARWIEHPRHTL